MATGQQLADGDSADGGEEEALSRIVDPDDYNLRRRLKQLHSAKEAVKDRKDDALDLERRSRKFTAEDRDRFVVEKLVDYIHELRPLLSKGGRAEQFLDEEVRLRDGETISLEEVLADRGAIIDDRRDGESGEREYLPYEASMAAWDVCNQYFEDVAGAVFENDGLPTESGFNSVGNDE